MSTEDKEELAQALCVVFVSVDDRKTWAPVKPELVPDWVKEPDVMANLLAGDCAQNEASGIAWYGAQRITPATKQDTIQ